MHELSISEAVIRQLENYAQAHPGCVIKKVTLEAGAISGVDRSALEFAFPLALESSPLTGVKLEIIAVPVGVECLDCHQRSAADKYLLKCARCLSTHVKICSGRELKIKSMEIEEA